jgi:hypothetical protein
VRDDTVEAGQQRNGAGPILNIGRVGQNGEQETERIDHDLALASSHLLAGIQPRGPLFPRLGALAVDDGGTYGVHPNQIYAWKSSPARPPSDRP